jgi:hypothetical protein
MHLAIVGLLAASPLWGSLEPGPHPPAYRITVYEDASRLDGPKRGAFADPGGPGPRRLAVHVWYPAGPGTGGEPLTLSDYSGLNRLTTRPAGPLSDQDRRTGDAAFRSLVEGRHRALTDAEWRALKDARGRAVYEAPPAAGRFPLLIGTLRPLSTAITAEYLASHGYVVAFVSSVAFGEPWEMDAQVRDMELAAEQLRREANVDPARTGALGFSGSGFAQLLLAMSNAHVDALVDLESALFARGFNERLAKSTAYRPAVLHAPFLHIYGRELSVDPRFPEDKLQDFRDMRYAERLRLVLEKPKLDHWDVATEGMATAAVTGMRGEHAVSVRLTFEAANLYARRFLDAHVKGDGGARAWLSRPPADHGLEGTVSLERLPAEPAVATAVDLERLLERRDVPGVASALRRAQAVDPRPAVLAEPALNRWGYRLLALGAQAEAVELFQLAAALYADSANAHDSLAEALEAAGRTADARAAAGKVLELLAGAKEPNAALKRANEERLRRLGAAPR